MAIGYKGSNGARTTDSNGFAFVKSVRFHRTSVQGGDIYGNFCSALGGWYQYAGGWYDSTMYMTTGDYYSAGSTSAGGGISDYGHVIGSVSSYTYWTVTTQNSTGGTVSGDGTFDDGATCTITATPSSGYVVTAVDGTPVSSISTGAKTKSFTVNSDRADVTATFEAYYRLAFNKGVASAASNMPVAILPCVVGGVYQIPTVVPTSAEYKFIGWSTSAEKAQNKQVDYQPGDNFTRTAAITAGMTVVLYAAWTPKFTVKIYKYNKDHPINTPGLGYAPGISGDSRLFSVVEGDGTTIPSASGLVVFPLHTCVGWNTSVNLDGTFVPDGGDISNLDAEPGSQIGLYAVWRFVGFNLTATKTTGAGTLTLQKDGTTVATESSGTLTYTGEVDGAEYRLVCTMADGYALPPMPVSPTVGASLSLVFVNPLYFVSLPAADASGNSFSVTSPAAPDGTVDGKDAYVAGRNVVVMANLGDEQMLTAAYLDDENHVNFATYTGDSIAGGKFTINSIDRSCYVRGTFAARQYSVTCAADTASASALTVAVSASSVTKNVQVTFTATPATGYSFEGWYLDGVPAPDSTVEEEGVPTTYHYNDPIYKCAIASDTHLVAKAKVAVSLDVSGAAQLAIDGATVSVPYSAEVTLGDSFSFLVEATAPDTYFLGWFAPGGDIPLPDYGSSGTVTPSAAIDMTARFGDVDPTLPVMITVAYADGSDSTRGTFSIDGGTATTVQKTYRDTVVLETIPKNGYLFAGWFLNAAGQGTPAATTPKVEMLATLSRTYYARFAQNDHSICEWEGSKTPKALVWRSKTYAASKPFNPSACRVDGLGYPPSKLVELTVDMFSAPDVNAKPTASTTLTNIANQDARRLPVRRMERYMQVQIKANAEIDTLLVGTSMEGLAI